MLKRFGFKRETLSADILAGLIRTIAAIPDAVANSTLAGINPVHGLYAILISTPFGGLFTSANFMNISVTSAMSVAIFDALSHYAPAERSAPLITLTLIVGVMMLLAGIFNLGRLVNFVSNAVMTGFLTGLALNIILGQLNSLTGYDGRYANKVLNAGDLLLNFDQIDIPIFAVGVLCILLIVVISRLRALEKFAYFIPLVVAVLLTQHPALQSVPLVGDESSIPSSLPIPALPDLRYVPELLVSGIAIAIIGLLQGAGISQSYPNPNGKYPNISADFRGQGIGNIAASFFQGMPTGGSLSGSAMLVSAGAKSRLANVSIFGFTLIGILVFASVIELIPDAALAAMLVVIGFEIIKFDRLFTVFKTGMVPFIAMLLTLIATLVAPLQIAVFVGVIISILLVTFQNANKVSVKQLLPPSTDNHYYQEQVAPRTLADNDITILMIYGGIFFAAAKNIEENLPIVEGATNTVVILRLRGHEDIGSTFIGVLRNYADTIQKADGHLLLAGVNEKLYEQFKRTGIVELIGRENIFFATEFVGKSLDQAVAQGNALLKQG